MDNTETVMYALLTLDRKNDIIKITNLNSSVISKYIFNEIEECRKDIPYINARDENVYVDHDETKITDEDRNAVIFFESVFKLRHGNLLSNFTKIRVIDEKLYSILIKENDINSIINMCMAIKPKYDYGLLEPFKN